MEKGENSKSDLPENDIRGNYQRIQDLVFITLRDEILSGKLQPDEKLNTSQLAKRLGVSRTPIREALNRLVAVGLVETIPHRGIYIRKLSIEEVIELYYIRAALEGIAARLAVRNLTEEKIKSLYQYCEDMEEAHHLGKYQNLLDINAEFHETIYKATQSPQLQDLLFQYYSRSRQYRTLGLELPGRYKEIFNEHRQLVAALESGDMEKADYYAREHHLNTARQIAKSIGSDMQI